MTTTLALELVAGQAILVNLYKKENKFKFKYNINIDPTTE